MPNGRRRYYILKKKGTKGFLTPEEKLLYGDEPIFMQVSILLTFYDQIFCSKVFCVALLYLQFGFIIFCQNNINAKPAHKILMKLTTGLNFIVFLWPNLLYKFVFWSFSLRIYSLLCIFWQKNIGEKGACKMLVKLTTATGFNFIDILQADFCVKVKPVYIDHPWDPNYMAVVDRWSLFRSSFVSINSLLNCDRCRQVISQMIVLS